MGIKFPGMRRRDFLSAIALGGAALHCPSLGWAATSSITPAPPYLRSHPVIAGQTPRVSALEWFRSCRFGLFLHYGLYSLLGRHEWVQFKEKIPVAHYAKLKDQFTADKFDADFITDLALEAGMKYVNLTTRHHDSFCLWDTKQTDFKSTNSPAKRDLVAELAAKCHAKGLGLFFYYSHGRDWKHPHAPNNDRWGGSARPAYDPPDPAYATGKDHDLSKYLEFMTAQIKELLTGYGPVAGIWLDGIGTPMNPRKGTGCESRRFPLPGTLRRDSCHPALRPGVLQTGPARHRRFRCPGTPRNPGAQQADGDLHDAAEKGLGLGKRLRTPIAG